MSAWLIHKPIGVLFGALVAASVAAAGVGQASAQQPATPRQPPATDTFATNPGQVLQQFPNGGPEIVTRIRDLAATPANLPLILGLLPYATKNQKSAMGSALAQTVRIALRTNLAYATRIQQAVAVTGDDDLIFSYLAVLGDVQIGGVGGGAAGGGGAIGSQSNPLGSPTRLAQATGTNAVPNQAFSYTGATVGEGSSPSGAAGTTSTADLASRSVSTP